MSNYKLTTMKNFKVVCQALFLGSLMTLVSCEKKDEIETLRERLLVRIDELNNRTHRYNRTFNWHYEVKEIINDLFGVV